jgi:hypothetical protein
MRPILACWRRVALLVLAFPMTLALCSTAWADPDPPGRVGRLADLRGTVWIYDNEQGEWVQANRNRPITTGDRLSVDHDSRAVLQIGSATVRLDADTQVYAGQIDDERIRFELQDGSLAARLRNADVAAQFEVDTADGRFQPLRAGLYRVDRDDTVSAASALSGEMRFDSNDSALTIPNSQRAEFWKEAGVTHYTWAQQPADPFNDWVLTEDRRDQRPPPRYVSPEMTGYEDLDRYGQWDNHPDYGALWIPAQVAPGWAPYRYGHWAWVSPWGWTWVDDAPWGFAPFHYGRWLYWRDRWCWSPGGYVARPVYAPALVGWVGGPSVNVSIHIGSGPVVGWVPLAPREEYRPWYPMPREHWRYINPHTPDRFYRPGEIARGPIQYANRTVPGAVTIAPEDAVKRHQPVGNFARQVDPKLAQQLVAQPATHTAPPPPPAGTRLRPSPEVPRAGGAVPPPPNRPEPGEMADGRRGHGAITQRTPERPETPAAQAQAQQRPSPPRAQEAQRPVPPPPNAQPQATQQTRPQPPRRESPVAANAETPRRPDPRVVDSPRPVPPSPPELRRQQQPHQQGREVPLSSREQLRPPPQMHQPQQPEARPMPPQQQPAAREEGEGRRQRPQEPRENREGHPGGPRLQTQ